MGITELFMLTISVLGWVTIVALTLSMTFALAVAIGVVRTLIADGQRSWDSHCEPALALANGAADGDRV